MWVPALDLRAVFGKAVYSLVVSVPTADPLSLRNAY
jgi:hypothetical protein